MDIPKKDSNPMADAFWKKWNTKMDELERTIEATGNDKDSLFRLYGAGGPMSKYSEECIQLLQANSGHLDKAEYFVICLQYKSIMSGPEKRFRAMWDNHVNDEAASIKKLPLNSAIMADVKSLYQMDRNFLIVYSVSPNAPPGIAEISPIAEIYHEKLFHVISVNQKRFDAGKRSKIFDIVVSHHGDPNSTRTRNLLALFILACHMQKPTPSRPKKVWFETADDVNQPHVKSFMSLMGCPDIDAAPPAMMKLLRENNDTRKANGPPKEAFPNLN